MDFEKFKQELEQQVDTLSHERDALDAKIDALMKGIEACEQLLPYSEPDSPATVSVSPIASCAKTPEHAPEKPVPDAGKSTRRKSHAKELIGAAPIKPDQKIGTCSDCNGPCSPTARRCRDCHKKQDRRHVRFSAFDRPADQIRDEDEQENAPMPIASAEPLTQSEPAEQESEPEVFRMKNYQQQRESKKASCGTCVLRDGFLAAQPGCPVHGIKASPLASSLGGQ